MQVPQESGTKIIPMTFMNLVTPKVMNLVIPKVGARQVGLKCHSSVIKISLSNVNLLTPKAGAKHELLFNKPASMVSLLNIQIGLKCYKKV